MAEKIIEIIHVDPIVVYGVNDVNINLLKKRFPKLKIIARGDKIKLVGDKTEMELFEASLNTLIEHSNRYGNVDENNIDHIIAGEGLSDIEKKRGNDIIVMGNSGLVVKARTPNQKKMVESIAKNDMLFAIGPAGTGKTYTAVALAVRALRDKEVRKIILCRPAVEAGEHLGFLPGDLKEKLDPYLQPLYDALFDMIPAEKLEQYIHNQVIQIAPLAFMRGRTLDNAFVILDEAQNATESQIKMFLTRMGSSAKFIITGDISQIDLPAHQPSGLLQAARILKGIEGIDFITLDNSDVIRHKLVKKIISVYEQHPNIK